jgi:hypothetical protein
MAAMNLNEDGEEMLTFIQEIKTSPDYQDLFSENTRKNFDLYEKALCGDSNALFELSISRGLL